MQLTSSRERAARALMAWWEEAGVDVEEARALAAEAIAAPARNKPAAPAPARAKPNAAQASSPVAAAEAAAASAPDIPALAKAIAAFEGCALRKPGVNTVVMDGVIGAPVLLIGEAPGAEEDRQGKPFVGQAGQLLDRMFAAIGLSRQSNVLISNCVFWRPPGNRNPAPEELAVCRPFVERLIQLAQPKMMILAGGVAAQTMLKRTEGVTRLRGQRFAFGSQGLTTPVNAMVMLHPAYLLRQPLQKRQAWADLLALETWLDELGVRRDPRP